MSKSASILTVAIAIILGSACKKKEYTLTTEEQARAEAAGREEDQKFADELVQDFTYVYDARTDICGIYFWRSWGFHDNAVGGPAFSVVDCTDKVRAAVANPPAAWSQPATAPPSVPPVDPSQPAEDPAAP